MGATAHVWRRLVDVPGIEGLENLVTVAVGQHASAIDVFLVGHLFPLHVFGRADRLQRSGCAKAGNIDARHVGRFGGAPFSGPPPSR
jgi:hypothetical protein